MRAAVLLLLALAACGPRSEGRDVQAGLRLEQAALIAGLVPTVGGPLTGAWARDGDRMCVAPPAAGQDEQRVGIVLDYGPGNGCVARGTARRSGNEVAIDLGACRVQSRYDGGRIVFPTDLDDRCAPLCRGNATLSALRVERVSDSGAEALALRSPAGRLLCSD